MRVFVTGASSGLGEGLARHYAVAGAAIGLVARRARELEALANELRAKGAQVLVAPGDVTDTAAMAATARQFVDTFGGVDLVIANAGIGIKNETLLGKSEPIARLMQVNVIGVTNTIVPFVPAMVAQKSGTLVAVSSMAGHRGLPGRAAYSASKAAVTMFMDGLRQDLHGTGVHAMTLCPGFVHTPLTASLGKMPFVISCDQAVTEMSQAIADRQRTFTFPWQVRLLSGVLKMLPEPLVRRVAPPGRTKALE